MFWCNFFCSLSRIILLDFLIPFFDLFYFGCFPSLGTFFFFSVFCNLVWSFHFGKLFFLFFLDIFHFRELFFYNDLNLLKGINRHVATQHALLTFFHSMNSRITYIAWYISFYPQAQAKSMIVLNQEALHNIGAARSPTPTFHATAMSVFGNFCHNIIPQNIYQGTDLPSWCISGDWFFE